MKDWPRYDGIDLRAESDDCGDPPSFGVSNERSYEHDRTAGSRICSRASGPPDWVRSCESEPHERAGLPHFREAAVAVEKSAKHIGYEISYLLV